METTVDLLNQVNGFNEISEHMQDEELTQTLVLIAKLISKPDVPASVLLSKLFVVGFHTTTWFDELPLGTTKTFIPLRATNSFGIVFFFHCPKEKFFYVY